MPVPPPKLDYSVYLAAIRTDASAFIAVLDATPVETPVPSCPAWSLSQLAAHVGDFAAFYTHAICDSTGAPRPPWPNTWRSGGATPLNGRSPATYFSERAEFLLSLLQATSPDGVVRTWAKDDQTAHFVARRAAHELAVHRFDAQLAAGKAAPIGGQLAADGIEEVLVILDHFLERSGARPGGQAQQLHLHSTDQDMHWHVVLGGDGLAVSHEPAAAGLRLSGTTSDLELVLYHRPPLFEVSHEGDDTILDAWYRTFTF